MDDRKTYSCCCLCEQLRNEDVIHGVGAVLIFIGITMCITGTIFTVVAFNGVNENIVPSFPYAGPVLIGLSFVSMFSGYILSHVDGIAKIWYFIRHRKEFMYQEDVMEDEYIYEEIDDVLSALCLWCFVKCFVYKRRRINSRRTTLDAGIALTDTMEVCDSGSVNPVRTDTEHTEHERDEAQTDGQNEAEDDTNSRRHSFASMSSILNTKIHPGVPDV